MKRTLGEVISAQVAEQTLKREISSRLGKRIPNLFERKLILFDDSKVFKKFISTRSKRRSKFKTGVLVSFAWISLQATSVLQLSPSSVS